MAKNISNLDKSLKQNITPADIGAATASHGTHLTIGTGASNAAAGNHTHSSYATTTQLTTTNNNIGTLSSLKTSAKNNLVAAINEVFQSGANVKQQLVDILVANGASVSTSDSWDTLINYINENSNNSSLDIISATTLPATGKENQICVITENPNTILMTTDISDISSLSTNTIGCLIKEGKPSNVTEGGLLQITGDLTYSIYMKYFIQNGSYIPSYIYKNANWEEFTKEQINFIKDGYYVSPNPFGTFVTSFTVSQSKRCLKYDAGKGVVTYYNAVPGHYYMWNTLPNKINFEGYNTIRITAYAKQLTTWTANPMVKFYTTTVSGVASNSSKSPFTHPSYVDSVDFQSIPFRTPTDLYFDISSWTGEKYLAMMCYVEEDSSATGNHIIITDISFM